MTDRAADMVLDPAPLTAELIRRPSVTPADAGAIGVVAEALERFGFACTRIERGGIENLYARYGTAGPVLGFNGHTDVVPAGDEAAWTHPPFSGVLVDGEIWGRGATDMKSGVAAWVAAACDWAASKPATGSLALLITGDEEGVSADGTLAILDWMAANDERLDACVVGEPTAVEAVGDMIKIGRRGAMTVSIHARGVQGHTAYPQRARNPLHALVTLLDHLAATPLDEGSQHFDPSTLQITTIDVGNPASNVIPAEGRAVVNIRFNDLHDSASVMETLRAEARRVGHETGVIFSLEARVSGESFLTPPGAFIDRVAASVARAANRVPTLSTTGGTSDARFVTRHCPVVEVGLPGRRMHGIDERVPVEEVRALARVYRAVIDDFFAAV